MLFRFSTLVAVLTGVVACAYVGEISASVAIVGEHRDRSRDDVLVCDPASARGRA